MILDRNLNFEPLGGAALTVTRDSTDILDFLNARDMGPGDPDLHLQVQTGAAFTSAGATTLVIALQLSVDNVTYFTVWQTPAIAKTLLVANARVLTAPIPYRSLDFGDAKPRYMKLNYAVATGPFTAGTIFSGLVLGAPLSDAYPPGIVISN